MKARTEKDSITLMSELWGYADIKMLSNSNKDKAHSNSIVFRRVKQWGLQAAACSGV